MQPWFESLCAHFTDPSVDEVTVVGTQSLCVLAKGTLSVQASPFQDAALWMEAVQIFCLAQQLRLTPRTPSAGGTWKAGAFRWHAILPPVSACGTLFSLRRHRFESLHLESFTGVAQVSQVVEWAQERRPLLICGPTGSGKTSFMTALLRQVAYTEKVLIVEDLLELPLLSPTWIKLAVQAHHVTGGQVSFQGAFTECLRMHPDRIVVGEMRDSTACPFLQILHAGHSGFMATFHAQTVEGVQARLPPAGGPPTELGLVFLERGVPPRVRAVGTLRV